MPIQDAFLAELAHEMNGLRRTIERVPPGDLDWTPHGKSMTFRGLVTHLVHIPLWGKMTVQTDEFDVAPDGVPIREEPVGGIDEALERLDANVQGFEEALREIRGDELSATWTLKNHGDTVFSMPRIGVLRGMIMSHVIHHRAQLGLYLRLRGVALPALYGPSADEG